MRKEFIHENPLELKRRSQWEDLRNAAASGTLRLQSIIDENFKPRASPVKHDKTAVLMLHWKESDMDVTTELNDLQHVFQHDYHFDVEQHPISAQQFPRPLKQFNAAITSFISKFDGCRPLYIIYYAGHGWPSDGAGSLTLLGKTDRESTKNLDMNTVAWTSVEKCLKDVDAADILVVFDCCHAGALNADHRTPYRFEFLGACNNGEVTPKPGKNSFTSAMIWALKDLLKTQPGFGSIDLSRKIKDYDGLKCNPVLFPRFQQQSAVPVWIEPMSTLEEPQAKRFRPEQNEDVAANATIDWFDLRFHFERGQEDRDIEHFVQSFKSQATTLGLLRIMVQDRAPDPTRVKPHAHSWFNKTFSPSRIKPHFGETSKPDELQQARIDLSTETEGPDAAHFPPATQFLSPDIITPGLGSEDLHSEHGVRRPATRRHSASNPVGTRTGRVQKASGPTKALQKGRNI
ncbi:MAG: hypothetical protein Q9160_004213 [Pyrenula sp. 1 TL-2023]